MLPQLKPGRCPPESQETPSGSPGWHLLATEHRGLHLAQGCMGDLALDSRSPSAYPKAGGRGWPADTVLCCPRRLGSQQSRPWGLSSQGQRCPLTLGSPEQVNDLPDPNRVPRTICPGAQNPLFGASCHPDKARLSFQTLASPEARAVSPLPVPAPKAGALREPGVPTGSSDCGHPRAVLLLHVNLVSLSSLHLP